MNKTNILSIHSAGITADAIFRHYEGGLEVVQGGSILCITWKLF